MKEVLKAASLLGLHVATYSPGDGITRYRFFLSPTDFFDASRCLYTALGPKEAKVFLSGYRCGLTSPR